MEVIVGVIYREETEDIAVRHHKAKYRYKGIDNTEDDEVETSDRFTHADREESEKTAHHVHDVVDGIHMEDEERVTHKEAGDADEGEHDTQNPGELLHEAVHKKKGEKGESKAEV